MVRKLAVRGLRRGIGSMDYIETLLIMEDDLDDESDTMGEFGDQSSGEHANRNINDMQGCSTTATQSLEPSRDNTSPELPEWCRCGKCRPMPQQVENKCCGLKKCITMTARFSKLCLDPDVLELCIRNADDIQNDREDNSTRAFRKAAYRQFTLARYGHLGKGKRRVCPSCVVLKIRGKYPSVTGVYMGYRDR